LVLTAFYVRAQIATEYGTPIKWDQYDSSSKYVMKGLDTLSNDSILISRDRYIRQDQHGLIIEDLNYAKLNSVSCDDEGPKLTGYWTKYYKSGEINEIGKIVCNKKIGEWLYFYKSGQIKKFEKYEKVDIIDSNPNVGYLNGSYLEYHPNGKIKVSGSYRIIEEKVEYEIVNIETYKIQKKCCNWILKSIKTGQWTEYNDRGEIIKIEEFNLSVQESQNLRELADRYLEIDINELRNKR